MSDANEPDDIEDAARRRPNDFVLIPRPGGRYGVYDSARGHLVLIDRQERHARVVEILLAAGAIIGDPRDMKTLKLILQRRRETR